MKKLLIICSFVVAILLIGVCGYVAHERNTKMVEVEKMRIQEKTLRTKERMKWVPWYKSEVKNDE